MRKIHIIIALLLSTPCWAAFSLVQQASGGTTNQNFNPPASPCCTYPFTTSTGAYPSNTTAGSLLVFVGWLNTQCIHCGNVNVVAGAPVTSGFTWTQATSKTWGGTSTALPLSTGFVNIFYIKNAGVMGTGVTTTWTVQSQVAAIFLSGPPTNVTMQADFALFEFSGLSAFPLERTTIQKFEGSSSSTPTTANITANNTGDLLFEVYDGDLGTSYGAAGSGFTLGLNATTAVGQSQYKSASSGTNTGNSFGGTTNNWSAITAVFALSASPPSAVSRRKGYVF